MGESGLGLGLGLGRIWLKLRMYYHAGLIIPIKGVL